jgi:hypothetical protein
VNKKEKEEITTLLQCPPVFMNFSNFSKQHTDFGRQGFDKVIEILQGYVYEFVYEE